MANIVTGKGPLTGSEQRDLTKHEKVIERGVKTFVEVGKALLAVRSDERKLYREFGTFEDYCQERWGFSKSRAYQLIDASKTQENVHNCGQNAPTNEAQARELARLPDEQQAGCWKDYAEECEADDVRPTAAGLREKVDLWKADNEPPDLDPEPDTIDVDPEPVEPAEKPTAPAGAGSILKDRLIKVYAAWMTDTPFASDVVGASVLENLAMDLRNE